LSWPIAGYILFYGIVSVVATALLPDYTNRDISEGQHGESSPRYVEKRVPPDALALANVQLLTSWGLDRKHLFHAPDMNGGEQTSLGLAAT
jgi:hypothetical protein